MGTQAPVPADLLIADTFLIRSELSVSHELMTYLPGLVSGGTKSLTLYREFYTASGWVRRSPATTADRTLFAKPELSSY